MFALGRWMEGGPERVVRVAEEILWVRRRDGRSVRLEANAVQRAFERAAGRENVVLKARQMGMTTWVVARFFLRTITRPGTLTLEVAQSREAAEALFEIARRMWECLPQEWKDGPLRLRALNRGQMVFAETGSEFRVGSAADENAGRGLSVQCLHCSEVSRWPGDAKATLAGLRAALAPGGECVLESTPNGAYGAFYEEWSGAAERTAESGAGVGDKASTQRPQSGGVAGAERVAAGIEPVRHFFPWWMEPGYVGPAVAREEMNAAELALVAAHGLSGEQVGFRRGLERRFGALRAQEFAEDAETCFRATGSCCFEVSVLEARLREAPEPVERRRNGALEVWLRAVGGRRYLLAVDTCGGGEEGDFAAAQVVDRVTGLQCAELRERLRPAELARVVTELAREYGGAMVVVERNNHGAAVLALLEGCVSLWKDARGEAGWLTTAASKPGMVARLGAVIAEGAETLMSRRLLAECRTFVSGEGGRMGAASGSHDDLVMSMAVALSARAEMCGR